MRLSWVLVVAAHVSMQCQPVSNCPRKKGRVRFLENQQIYRPDVTRHGGMSDRTRKMGFAGEDFARAYFT
ncbi:unnamed protein product [Ectocarpus sp. 6 AP-2014]